MRWAIRMLLAGMLLWGGGLAFSQIVAAEGGAEEWGYDGEQGPAYWGQLSPDYATCATGREQSPIDIPAWAPVNQPDLQFVYQSTPLTIVNNGHTVKVAYGEGSFMTLEGKQYKLLQFHFHAPSEHTWQGQYFPIEAHFVHQSDDGEYAVVGVFIREGAENTAYQSVWDHLPPNPGDPQTIEGVSVNAMELLPADTSYYRYDGSFTTPPCTEGVKWVVMATPVEMSTEQIAAFQAIYDHNNRPVQPLNARTFYLGGAPQTLPQTGRAPAPAGWWLVSIGVFLLGAGLIIRRRALV
nr:carbonic anhydrase family protein [Ardenticatena sp.]